MLTPAPLFIVRWSSKMWVEGQKEAYDISPAVGNAVLLEMDSNCSTPVPQQPPMAVVPESAEGKTSSRTIRTPKLVW